MNKRKSTLAAQTLLLTVLLAGNPLMAGQDRAAGQPVSASGLTAQIADMPDPTTLTDDICWVAPEWRDD